ncbi:MAG: hypothetical protein ACI33P_06230 [Lysinibacillus sp.]
MYRKFTKLYIFLLLAFIVLGGIGIFFSEEPSEEELAGLEEEIADKTPGYATMMSLSQIAEKHMLGASVLDIQVSAEGGPEEALLLLQALEFPTEDSLLKSTFNMLQDIQQIDTLGSFTITWYTLMEEENAELLTLFFDREGLDRIQSINYTELPSVAADYDKHESLQ